MGINYGIFQKKPNDQNMKINQIQNYSPNFSAKFANNETTKKVLRDITNTANDVDDLMSSNPVTDIAIKCGAYQFVENHLVINNEKFITYDKFGRQTLTQFARNNIQLCCIPFTISPKTTTKFYII